jgi:hypothetical protein
MGQERVEFLFPLWCLFDTQQAKAYGEILATHKLYGSPGDVDLPLFQGEATATAYMANLPLPGHELKSIDDVGDLQIVLENFRRNGGTHVRIDDPGTGEPFLSGTVAEFLSTFGL